MDEIYETWRCADRLLSRLSVLSKAAIDWDARLRFNTYGYFILLFATLERYIDGEFEQRFGDPSEHSFRNRFHLLYSSTSKCRELLESYYAIRNDIAHGRTQKAKSLPLESVIRDFQWIKNAEFCGSK